MKEPLFLIPGFANNELAWKYQVAHLQEHFEIRVLVMNNFSTRKEMVDHLLQTAPLKFYLAGHSMGGWVAQAAAAKAPERVEKLILFNTWATLDQQIIRMQEELCETLKLGRIAKAMQEHLAVLIHPSYQQDMALIHFLEAMIGSFSIQELIRQLEAMLNDYSSLKMHPQITAPTLIVQSRQEALFPNEHKTLSSGIKHSKVAYIENCGHASIIEKPEETTQLMRTFLLL